MNKPTIQTYINNFRRRIVVFLKPGVGLLCRIYPADAGGAVLEFQFGPSIENDDIYREPSPTLGRALAHVEQSAFGGNLDGFSFHGTNVVLEKDRIIFIKDDSDSEWTDAAAQRDAQRIGRALARGAK